GRGGATADVARADRGGARGGEEPALELAGGDPVVLADGEAAAAVTADEGCVGAADLTEDVGVDVRSDEPAHVIGAEHVRVEHLCGPLGYDIVTTRYASKSDVTTRRHAWRSWTTRS